MEDLNCQSSARIDSATCSSSLPRMAERHTWCIRTMVHRARLLPLTACDGTAHRPSIWICATRRLLVRVASRMDFWGYMMRFPRRKFLHLAAGAAALPAVLRVAMAQAYPTRPLRLIVGFPPGGA